MLVAGCGPEETPSPRISGSPIVVAAGGIAACASTGEEATVKLLDSIGGTVFTLVNNVYGSGTSTEFSNCYRPSWGRHKARAKPSVSNPEYYTAGARGYFGYFGSAAGDPKKDDQCR
jgi:hypothetical protein